MHRDPRLKAEPGTVSIANNKLLILDGMHINLLNMLPDLFNKFIV